jgi:hypothetical protein
VVTITDFAFLQQFSLKFLRNCPLFLPILVQTFIVKTKINFRENAKTKIFISTQHETVCFILNLTAYGLKDTFLQNGNNSWIA